MATGAVLESWESHEGNNLQRVHGHWGSAGMLVKATDGNNAEGAWLPGQCRNAGKSHGREYPAEGAGPRGQCQNAGKSRGRE